MHLLYKTVNKMQNSRNIPCVCINGMTALSSLHNNDVKPTLIFKSKKSGSDARVIKTLINVRVKHSFSGLLKYI